MSLARGDSELLEWFFAGRRAPTKALHSVWLRLVCAHPCSLPKSTGRSGRSAVWLAHLTGGQGVGGSNPLAPTNKKPRGTPRGFAFVSGSFDRHDDLAARAAGFEVAVGVSDGLQSKRPIDDRSNRPGVDQPCDLAQVFT